MLLLLLLTGFCCLQITSSRAAVASLLAVLSHYSSQSRLPSNSLSHSGLSVTSPLENLSASETSASSNTESDTNATGRGSNELSNSGTDRLSTQGSSNAEAAQAAATALQNLVLNKDAQSLVVDLQGIATVAKLLSPLNWLLAARAAGDVAHIQVHKGNVADVKYADILPLMCVYCTVPCTRSLSLRLVSCVQMSKTMFAHPIVTHYFSSKLSASYATAYHCPVVYVWATEHCQSQHLYHHHQSSSKQFALYPN